MTLQAIIKVQDDTAKLWGVTPVDIDKAFMKKAASIVTGKQIGRAHV